MRLDIVVVVVFLVVVVDVVTVVVVDARNTPLKFGQNRVSKSWDIANIDTAAQIFWLKKICEKKIW